MLVKFKDTEFNISFTSADVLETIGKAQTDIPPILSKLKGCKTLNDMAKCIREIGEIVEPIVVSCGVDSNAVFPTHDIVDYFNFLNTVIKSFNSAEFDEIRLES